MDVAMMSCYLANSSVLFIQPPIKRIIHLVILVTGHQVTEVESDCVLSAINQLGSNTGIVIIKLEALHNPLSLRYNMRAATNML